MPTPGGMTLKSREGLLGAPWAGSLQMRGCWTEESRDIVWSKEMPYKRLRPGQEFGDMWSSAEGQAGGRGGGEGQVGVF